MAQIMALETDEIAVIALKKIFAGDDEIKLIFNNNFNEAVEILNGNPADTEVFEKFKKIHEEAKKEFQEAAARETTAKITHDNAFEILEKYRNELDDLKNPDPKANKSTQTEAAPAELENQKQSLEKEIERLVLEVKKFKEVLFETSKIKLEKEKIAKDKEIIADVAKAKIPAPADQIYSVLLISSKFLLPNSAEWVGNFKKTIIFEPNQKIKIVVLGFEFDEKTIKKYLIPGISDYMIKPVDELLARQNLKFLALAENKAKREVYSLQINEPVDLIFEYELEGLSELSFVIASKDKFEINEFKVFNCNLFLRKSQQSVLGKCLSSSEKSGGGFTSEFWFVGMDTHLAFQIKNVIKNAPKL